MVGQTRVVLLQGDITEQDTQAIVNAANSRLAGGGGVDGAIHRAGGPAIMAQCDEIRARQGGCPTGQAVLTTGGRLKAQYVIHTVGPIWRGGDHNEDQLLASAYQSSLRLALQHGIKSVAFPSISTGAYGFPLERAAAVAVRAVEGFLLEQPLQEVRWVLFSQRDFQAYLRAWQERGYQQGKNVE
ncbi:MAG: O-acetyl-ADP-ribose deacetylase [Bacillota bacterium]|uniref:O-acetyl-ADP-ribose deacetylase n=1 Tax=Desulfurispora thermophila TaxID=265470 RepID=UPI00052431BD|nr:O-acetyl-ADP-ribose deacetylase [Desulfurispora thermophila]